MKKSLFLLFFYLILFGTAHSAELVASAAASLTDAMNELKTSFEKNHPGNKVLCNYGASGTLARQIEGGAPTDVFVSASAKQMDRLQSEKLILPGTRFDLLENDIVLIVPKDSKLGLKDFPDLPKAKRIAIGDPGFVPAGQYAKQILTKLGLMGGLASKMVYGEDVRQVLEYVARGEVDAGIVFFTDAAILPGKVKIAARAPEDSHKPVVYPAAVLKGGEQHELARQFLRFVSGPEGRKVFTKYGFQMVNKGE